MSNQPTEISLMRIVYRNSPDDIERGIEFDAVLEETHQGVSEITDHAVDVGVDLSDHSRSQNREFSFLASVTNTPIRTPKTHSDDARGLDNKLPPNTKNHKRREGASTLSSSGNKVVGGRAIYDVWTPAAEVNRGRTFEPIVFQFDKEMDRVQKVFLTLEGLRVKALICQVNTLIGRYDNMLIQRVDAPVRAAGPNEIEFKVHMRQIRIAEVQTTKNAPRPGLVRAQKPKAKGGKAKEETEDEKLAGLIDTSSRLTSQLAQQVGL